MKTRIGLAPDELGDDDRVLSVWVSVERADGPDDEDALYGEKSQDLFLSPDELQSLYHRMRVYFEQGTWTIGTVEW